MGYNYIEINGSNEKLPPKEHFLFITKELQKPVKNKDNKDEYANLKKVYEDSIRKRKSMFEVFESRLVDMHDRSIEPDDITKRIGDIVANNKFDNNIIYLIEPLIVSKKPESSYRSWQSKNVVHTFNIVKEITSIEELFEHAYTNNYYEDFMADIFDKMRYIKEGYRENCIKWFEYAKEKYPHNEKNYPNFKLTLWDMVKEHNMATEETIAYMLENELILLHDKYDEESKMFKKLIQYKMFEIANKYLNLVEYEYAIKNIKSDRDSIAIMKSSSDNQFVKEIFKVLGIEDKTITLKITKYGEYENIVEEITFEDINKAKSYVIKNYVVDFDKVADGIDDGINVYNEDDDDIHIEVV